MPGDRQPVGPARYRYLLEEYLSVVLLVLLAAVILGGFLTYTAYAAPGGQTETRTVSSWTTTPEFTHSATVVRENEVFPTGSRLENRNVYYMAISPVLDGAFRTGYRATDDGTLDVRTDVDLVIRAVAEESNLTYWRVSEPLANGTTAGLAPGSATTTRFSVNVSQADTRRERITGSLGGTAGTVQTLVVVRTTYEGSVNGQDVTRTMRHEFPLVVDGDTYRIRGESVRSATFAETERVPVTSDTSQLQGLVGAVLLVVALVEGVVVLVGRQTGHLSVPDTERRRLVYERERAEFDEWITTGTVAEAALDVPTVTVDSLEGLVDIAIDTNRRVIETEGGRFVVPGDGLVYRYTRPPAPPADGPGADTGAAVGRDDGAGHETEDSGDEDEGRPPTGESTAAANRSGDEEGDEN